MYNNIVVTYKFSLAKDVDTKQLVDASAKLDSLLLGMNGFLYRSLTQINNDEWLDIVYWENEAALKKADLMNDNADFVTFMKLIDVQSVVRTQANVHSSVYPEMKVA